MATDTTGQVAGWTAAAPVSPRCIYAGVIEHSVYVASTARGQRLGLTLLNTLISSSEAAGTWTLRCSPTDSPPDHKTQPHR